MLAWLLVRPVSTIFDMVILYPAMCELVRSQFVDGPALLSLLRCQVYAVA